MRAGLEREGLAVSGRLLTSDRRNTLNGRRMILLTSGFGVRVPGGAQIKTIAHQQVLMITRILLVGIDFGGRAVPGSRKSSATHLGNSATLGTPPGWRGLRRWS